MRNPRRRRRRLLGLNHLSLTYLHNGRSERATVNGGKLIEEALA